MDLFNLPSSQIWFKYHFNVESHEQIDTRAWLSQKTKQNKTKRSVPSAFSLGAPQAPSW